MKAPNRSLPFPIAPPLATIMLAITMLATPAVAEEGEVETPVGPIRGDNPDIGIKYDKAQGLYVTPFSAKLLGLKMEDVEEMEITGKITLQAQIFQAAGGNAPALASAWLPREDSEKLTAGMSVEMERGFSGKIVSVAADLNQQGEVLLEIEDKDNQLKSGKFLEGSVEITSDGEVVVVPERAVVKSAEGAFAYVDNAGWTVRANVEVGASRDGMVEIVDGLYSGDVIVTNPVMTLWMTELQLLKSGRA